MLKLILNLLLSALVLFLGIYLIFFIFLTLKVKSRSKKGEFKKNFLNYKYPNLIEFIKWVIVDIIRGKDYVKVFGIWAFTGYYGQGKSLGAVNFALKLKKKHPHKNFKIYSNFDVVGQDGTVEKWEDLLTLPKNTILIFDEMQSSFASQQYKDFPMDLLWKLTQSRKHGLAIFCTSPVYRRLSIQVRESADYIVECRNHFKLDRWFTYNFYPAWEYEKYLESSGLGKKLKGRQYRDFRYTLIASDTSYSYYNTEQQISRMDIVEKTKGNKKINKNTYDALKNEILKLVEIRLKEVS